MLTIQGWYYSSVKLLGNCALPIHCSHTDRMWFSSWPRKTALYSAIALHFRWQDGRQDKGQGQQSVFGSVLSGRLFGCPHPTLLLITQWPIVGYKAIINWKRRWRRKSVFHVTMGVCPVWWVEFLRNKRKYEGSNYHIYITFLKIHFYFSLHLSSVILSRTFIPTPSLKLLLRRSLVISWLPYLSILFLPTSFLSGR